MPQCDLRNRSTLAAGCITFEQRWFRPSHRAIRRKVRWLQTYFCGFAGLLTRSGSRIVLLSGAAGPGFAAVVAPAFRGDCYGGVTSVRVRAQTHRSNNQMDSLSHDPAAGDIGSQLVEIGSRGLAAGNAATMPTMTGLVPAGGEEVSAQAVMAFATEAASMIASNTAAQEELMRAGTALTDIARMYGDTDDNAAGALTIGAGLTSRHPLAGGSGASAGAGLMRAGSLPGEAGSAARTPLMAQLLEGASSPMASTAANAGSSAMSGAAPVGSGMGAGTPAGGSSKAGLVSATGPADEDDKDPEDRRDQPSGERLA